MKTLMQIISCIAQFWRWLASKKEYDATVQGQDDIAKKKADAKEQEIQDVQKAVREGDEDKVNAQIKKLLIFVTTAILVAGCATKVIYIPQEQKAIRYDLNGQKGWWVPDAVFAQLLEKAMRNQK